jgi:hypothetical protein
MTVEYLMTYWINASDGAGHGNVPVTLPERPTVKDIRWVEAELLKVWQAKEPATTKIVMTGLIPISAMDLDPVRKEG